MDPKELIERLKYNGCEGCPHRQLCADDDTAECTIRVEAAAVFTALMDENAQLRADLEHKNNVVERYAASARSISLYLKEFCNKNLPYDEMISDAVRKVETELEQVKRERDAAKKDLRGYCWCCVHGSKYAKAPIWSNTTTCKHMKERGVAAIGGGRGGKNCPHWQWRGPKKEE